jgi:hypothetical protein
LLVQPTAAVLILIGVPGVGGVGGVDRREGGGGDAVSQQTCPHLDTSQKGFQFVERKYLARLNIWRRITIY